jgi:GntR family transcriptional regulator
MALKQIQAAELPLRAVDHDSPVPLYYQIEMDIKRLIVSGKLTPGDLLPPENELSRGYQVGRHTMRMALARLATEGLVSRQAGRGTFVRYQPDRTKFYLDRSFTRQMADMGFTAHSTTLSSSQGMLAQDCPQALQLNQGEPYFSMTRLRFGDGAPIAIQSTTILTRLCPGIAACDFNRLSLYDVLSNVYKLAITRIVHTISAAVADVEQADLLGIRVGEPLLVIHTSAYVESGEMIEFTTTHYRADKYEYSTTHLYPPDSISK